MKTSFLTIVSVLSAIVASTSAFATGENTVTSKAYVDAMDATKQDIITAKTTGNVVTYNGTQNGQTQFSERGIYDSSTGWDEENEQLVSGHEGDLVPASEIIPGINDIYNNLDAMRGDANTVVVRNKGGAPISSRDIYDGSTTYSAQDDANDLITAGAVQNKIDEVNSSINNVQSARVVKTTCANSPDCTLWTMEDVVVHKLQCETVADCANIQCAKSSGSGQMAQIVACNRCENHKCTYVEATDSH